MNQSSISTNNKINTHHNIASNSNTRWVPCTAKADFWGDGGASQLSFRKDARLEIDLLLPPQNGWRWGRIAGRGGWLPAWAAEPLFSKPHQEQKASSSSFQRQHRCRSNDRVAPLERIVEDPRNSPREPQQQNSPVVSLPTINASLLDSSTDGFSIFNENICDGFDTRNNEIMGGGIGLLREPTSERRSSEDGHRTRPEHRSVANEKPIATQNPYLTDQDQLDWDGSEVPQIWVNGTVTVLEADGKTSSYQNEKSYKIAEAKNRMVEQCQTLGKNFAGFKLPKSKLSRGSDGKNSVKLQQEPATAKANNKPRKQPFGKNGALKFPKMSSFPKKTKSKGKP